MKIEKKGEGDHRAIRCGIFAPYPRPKMHRAFLVGVSSVSCQLFNMTFFSHRDRSKTLYRYYLNTHKTSYNTRACASSGGHMFCEGIA